jgi:hypothetical protein
LRISISSTASTYAAKMSFFRALDETVIFKVADGIEKLISIYILYIKIDTFRAYVLISTPN